MGQSMAWRAGRLVAWTLPRLTPAGDAVLFGSDQPEDPDALVILDHLAAHSARPLRWTSPIEPARPLLGPGAKARVVTARESSARSLLAYGRAPIVFHTAGLYTSPPPARDRTVVTVWHGDGPKASHPPQVHGTFMVAGVERFGRRRIGVHGYPDEALLVTGRPRVDDLYRAVEEPVPAATRRALGLDDRPTVWWMPTWRQDAAGRATGMAGAATGALDVSGLSQHQFVVKPHRLSPPSRWPAGWHVVTDADLTRHRVRLYRLLGSAHAVLTDYSSVWSDFLGTRIPIGFVLGDLEQYSADRGFYEKDWTRRLPGPVLDGPDDLATLVESAWTDEQDECRRRVAGELGANNGPGATARLFDALDERGVPWR
jgi:CDP-glycerol glycerophosphotransferase